MLHISTYLPIAMFLRQMGLLKEILMKTSSFLGNPIKGVRLVEESNDGEGVLIVLMFIFCQTTKELYAEQEAHAAAFASNSTPCPILVCSRTNMV